MCPFAVAFTGAEAARISISVTVTFLVGIVHGNFRRETDDEAANIYTARNTRP